MGDAAGIAWDELRQRGQEDAALSAPLPGWAKVLCATGACLATREAAGPKYLVALSLPFKGFAVSLLALGYVTERLQVRSFTDRFQPNALVVVLQPPSPIVPSARPRRPYLAQFLGYAAERSSTPGVRLKRFANESECIWWRTGGTRLVPYTGHARLRKTALREVELQTNSLASALAGPDEANWIHSLTRVGVVGDEDAVHNDLREPLGYHGYEGTIGDLLIPGGNLRFASPRSESSIDDLAQWRPELVIFDNSSALNKWRHEFGESHQAVVLERSANRFDADYSIIEELFAKRAVGPPASRSWPEPTDTGLDMLVFTP